MASFRSGGVFFAIAKVKWSYGVLMCLAVNGTWHEVHEIQDTEGKRYYHRAFE